jgi:hypothetical protein
MHQVPYPKTSSVSMFPLELVFSDVLGAAPESVGRFKYYVSFIDDFSKLTWIYLIKNKSEVFQCFSDFQNLVERMFGRKLIAMQTDLGGGGTSIKSLIPFSSTLAYLTMFHVLVQISRMALSSESTCTC